jgi:hypothetical protein
MPAIPPPTTRTDLEVIYTPPYLYVLNRRLGYLRLNILWLSIVFGILLVPLAKSKAFYKCENAVRKINKSSRRRISGV